MKSGFLLIVIFLQSFYGYSQIIFSGLDQNRQSKLIQLKSFFISRSTIDFGADSGFIKPGLLKMYDTVINSFFNYEQMIKEFNNYEGGYKLEYLKYYQYRALNGIDKIMDYVQEDSIVIMNKKEYLIKYQPMEKPDTNQINDIFVGGFTINGDYYPMIEMKFDKFDKLVFIVPMIYFDNDKANVVYAFLKRQKN
jgi:hypothetical protein